MKALIRMRSLLVALVLFAMPFLMHAGPKTDTVYLTNGDRITGEVKRFEYGILFFKTDGMGTLNVEYDRIMTFYSNQQFIIQLANGLRFFGSIDTSAAQGMVNLRVNNFSIPEPISAIVEIYPVERAFWKRLDGEIDLGYSYTKASTISQLNFSGYLDYRVEKSYTRASISSIFTDQEDRERIRKQDYSFFHNRFFSRSWYASVFAGGQQNTELGVSHRYYGGLGLGNDLVQNNLHVLSGSLGFLVSSERSEGDSIVQSLEGAMQWRYKIFKFNNPEVELNSILNVYPSFTTWGRVRVEYELKAKIELFSDFYFGINFYDNYDNQPPEIDAESNDWGITTSIGYSW